MDSVLPVTGSLPTTTATSHVVTTTAPPTAPPGGLTVTGVTDGDTLTVSDGRRVRLAQVDAPETNDCFGSQSTAALRALSLGKTVELRRPRTRPRRTSTAAHWPRSLWEA